MAASQAASVLPARKLARAGTAWPIGLAVLLATLLAEWLPAGETADRPPPAPAAQARHSPQTPAPSRHVSADASTILARPLFSVRRRPPPATAGHSSGSTGALPRLSGIIIAGPYRRAIFESNGKTLGGSVGDHLGAYAIVAIAPRRVTVTGPAGEQVLALHFGAAQASPAPAPGPSIMDRLRGQHYRPPPLPSTAALQRLLQPAPTQPR